MKDKLFSLSEHTGERGQLLDCVLVNPRVVIDGLHPAVSFFNPLLPLERIL